MPVKNLSCPWPLDVGLEPERTRASFEWYLPEKGLGSEAARKSVAFSDEIQKEDIAPCEIVQKNLHSRSYHSGRYGLPRAHARVREKTVDPVPV